MTDDAKKANTRLVIGILAVVVITAVSMFVNARVARIADSASKDNRDGILCILDMMDRTPPIPREQIESCKRFLTPK